MLSCQYGIKYWLYNSFIFGANHEHVWIPFVTYPIGDSFAAILGHTSPNSSLDTAPCNLLTPFFFPAIFKASIPILNPFSSSFTGFIPSFKNSSLDNPNLGQKSLKYLSTKSNGNISFPAGTGVCVVNTVFELVISFATSKDTCFSAIIFLIISKVKNAECPSFMWYTVGFNFKYFVNNSTPACPKTISWRILISWSPPYNFSVTSLSSGLFFSISESNKYNFILPTFMLHTFKYNLLFGNFTYIIRSSPTSFFTGLIGKSYKSISLYSHCCWPSPSIFWLKYPSLYNNPTATNGIPKSLADFKWSPDNIPNPPE